MNTEHSIINRQTYYFVHEKSCTCSQFDVVYVDYKALIKTIKEIKQLCKENNTKLKIYTTMDRIKNMEQLADEANSISKIADQSLQQYNIQYTNSGYELKAELSFDQLKSISCLRLGHSIGNANTAKYNRLFELCQKVQDVYETEAYMDNEFIGI